LRGGVGAAPAGKSKRSSLHSGGLGIPPGPTMGACHEMAGRGAGDGGKSVVIGGLALASCAFEERAEAKRSP